MRRTMVGGTPRPPDAARAHLGAEVERAADRLATEFRRVFGPETVERVLGDSVRALGATQINTYVPLLAERFTRERLGALARADAKVATVSSVLFLRTHNAGRSQMAAGWLRTLAGGRVQVYSGGSEPASQVDPVAIEAMCEVGIEIAGEYPRPWTDEVIANVDVVVTMGCGDACPAFPGIRYVDWEVPDPAGEGLGSVRAIRDEIERRVRALLADLGVTGERA